MVGKLGTVVTEGVSGLSSSLSSSKYVISAALLFTEFLLLRGETLETGVVVGRENAGDITGTTAEEETDNVTDPVGL